MEPTNDDVRATWDALAPYWDEQMEAGRTWQRTLIQPAVEQLLELERGERVLELACGNGEFARRMASAGASVIATDFSSRMLERAKRHGGEVDYRQVDLTDEAALRSLAERRFDAVVCNMAIMDTPDIEPMAAVLPTLLALHGRFVLSTVHPAFNSADVTRVAEQTDDEHGVHRAYSLKISRYGTSWTGKGVAVEGQPVAQWYFHRPLEAIVEPFFRHGLVLDGLREPLLDPDPTRHSPNAVFAEIPGVLVLRFRAATV
jgi:2-polyprenyl-3-methyl-5-hydroxy-6-metoxy-1,4-benzoquinol methylase